VPDVAEELLNELYRAEIVDDLVEGVIRMGSHIEYRADGTETRSVTLVYPGQANIEVGKISILTPIGTALIGLCPGQSIDWTALDGRVHMLTIIAVDNSGLAVDEVG
jgi:regulator of nucleoside diphosphate kinase